MTNKKRLYLGFADDYKIPEAADTVATIKKFNDLVYGLNDRMERLEEQLECQAGLRGTVKFGADVDLENNASVKNIKDPVDPQDAVTLAYLKKYYDFDGEYIRNYMESEDGLEDYEMPALEVSSIRSSGTITSAGGISITLADVTAVLGTVTADYVAKGGVAGALVDGPAVAAVALLASPAFTGSPTIRGEWPLTDINVVVSDGDVVTDGESVIYA